VISRTTNVEVLSPPTFYNGLPEGEPFDSWNETEWVAPANIKFTMGAVQTGASHVTDAPYMVQSHCITPGDGDEQPLFLGLLTHLPA